MAKLSFISMITVVASEPRSLLWDNFISQSMPVETSSNVFDWAELNADPWAVSGLTHSGAEVEWVIGRENLRSAQSCDLVCSQEQGGKQCSQSSLDSLNNDPNGANLRAAYASAGRTCRVYPKHCEGGNNCVRWGAPYIHSSHMNDGICWGGSRPSVAPCGQKPVDGHHRRLCPCTGGSSTPPPAPPTCSAYGLLDSTVTTAVATVDTANAAMLRNAASRLNEELTAVRYHRRNGKLNAEFLELLRMRTPAEAANTEAAITQIHRLLSTMEDGSTATLDAIWRATSGSGGGGSGGGSGGGGGGRSRMLTRRQMGQITAGTWATWIGGVIALAGSCFAAGSIAEGPLLLTPAEVALAPTIGFSCVTAAVGTMIGAGYSTTHDLLSDNPNPQCSACIGQGKQWCWETKPHIAGGGFKGCQDDNIGLPDTWMCAAANCVSNIAGSHCSVAINDCVQPGS